LLPPICYSLTPDILKNESDGNENRCEFLERASRFADDGAGDMDAESGERKEMDGLTAMLSGAASVGDLRRRRVAEALTGM